MKAVNAQMGTCVDLSQCPSRRKMQALNWRCVIDNKTENLLQFLQILLPTIGIDAFDFLTVLYSSIKIQNTLNRSKKKDGISTSDKGDQEQKRYLSELMK